MSACAQSPIGELFATDPRAPSAAQPAGAGMTVLPGSELSAGIAPATLKLFRGGQVRICSQSQMTINSGNQGLLLAMSSGALEVNYRLEQSTFDLVATPDFNVRVAGPGSYHFALGVNGHGDTCFKALPGNTAGVVFSEPLGSDQVGLAADESALFPGGKLAARTALDQSCGCPIITAPALAANAQPGNTAGTDEGHAAQVLVAAQESDPVPSATPAQNQLQVETPFVFSATATGLPSGMAQIDFSALPNVFLMQDEVDPIVLAVKAADPAPTPASAASAKPEPTLAAQADPDPSKGPDKKKQKKGFGSRVKGFFGALFGH